MVEEELEPGESTDPLVVPAPAELRHRGAFMALLTFRPPDGGALQRIAGLADTEAYAQAEVFEAMRAALGQVQTLSPDGPAVRRFISAASHVHDLRQALVALTSASSAEDHSVARQLRTYAVVAYGRTYGSNIRPDLSALIDMSTADLALTARLKAVRNKYAAHSENGMTVTSPILDLQKELDETITVQEVHDITVDSPVPLTFINDFELMLHRLVDQLTAALQLLKDDIRSQLTSEQVTEAFTNPQRLQFTTAPVAEWEPTGRRPAYPSSRLSPVHLDLGGEESVQASIAR